MERSSNQLLLAGLVLFGGYLIFRYFLKPLVQVAQAGGEAIAAPLAKVVEWWSIPAPINVTGKYVLQDSGSTINPANFPVNWVNSIDPRAANYDGQLPTISVAGVTYVLGPHDDNGNYPAVRL